MDFTTLVSAISTVGFPIACCIYLIYSNNKADEKHSEEIEKLRITVQNNTEVMIKICERLGLNDD